MFFLNQRYWFAGVENFASNPIGGGVFNTHLSPQDGPSHYEQIDYLYALSSMRPDYPYKRFYDTRNSYIFLVIALAVDALC